MNDENLDPETNNNLSSFNDIQRQIESLSNSSSQNVKEVEKLIDKIMMLRFSQQLKIGQFILENLFTASDPLMFISTLKKIIENMAKKQFDDHCINMGKKYFQFLLEALAKFPELDFSRIKSILEVFGVLPVQITKNFNILPFMINSLALLEQETLLLLIPILLSLPIKNVSFCVILVIHDSLKFHTTKSNSKETSYHLVSSKFLALLIEETEYQTNIQQELITFLKLYVEGEKDVFEVPFLVLLNIFFYYRSNEIHVLMNILFGSLKSTDSGGCSFNENEEGLSDQIELEPFDKKIQNCFEYILHILKPIDSKPFFETLLKSVIEFSFHLLKYNYKPGEKLTNSINHEGQNLVLHMFKEYQELQYYIVDRILAEILHQEEKMILYATLLHSCCLFSHKSFLECSEKINSTLKYLLSFNTEQAKMFISVIMPFIKVSGSIKDSFLLILRQNMFSKDISCQSVSLIGYLMLLKNFKSIRGDVDMSQCTQYSNDSYGLTQHLRNYQAPLNDSQSLNLINEMMCIEVFEYLKRCLKLKESTKKLIYKGLKEVVSNNHQLIDPVLDLLIDQLETIFCRTPTEEKTHSKLFVCSSHPYLLSSMVLTLKVWNRIKSKKNQEMPTRINIANKLLKEMVDYFIQLETEMEIIQEFYNNNELRIVCKLLQVCMEYLNQENTEGNLEKDIDCLFERYMVFKGHIKKNKYTEDETVKNNDEDENPSDSLISLDFLIDHSFKLIHFPNENSDLFKSETYKKYIFKMLEKTLPVYLSNFRVNNYKDRYKRISKMLVSPIEFCSKVFLYPHMTSSDNSECYSSAALKILVIVFEMLKTDYDLIPPEILRDFNISLNSDFHVKEVETCPVTCLLLKLLLFLSNSEDSGYLLPKSDYINITKLFSAIYPSLQLTPQNLLYIGDSIVELFTKRSESLEIAPVAIGLMSIMLDISLKHENYNDSVLIFIKEHLSYYKNDRSQNSAYSIPSYINDSSIKKLWSLFTYHLSKRLNTALKSITILKNNCKIFKSINTKMGKKEHVFDFEILQGSFTDFYHNKISENNKLIQSLSTIYSILNEVVNHEIPIVCYLPLARTLIGYFNIMKNSVLLQRDLLNCKKMEQIPESFSSLVYKITANITPSAYSIMSRLDDRTTQSQTVVPRQKKSKSGVSAFRELQILPNLVFSIESFEKELASLSKIIKIDLTKGCRSNIAMDFKIDLAKIKKTE